MRTALTALLLLSLSTGALAQADNPTTFSGASTPVVLASQYPSSATPITASATGTTAVTTATLAAASGHTTYICGFTITAGATALATGAATITGTVTGTLNFEQAVLALTAGIGATAQTFNPCIPASAANTAIAVNSIAAGLGGTTAVTAWGYQL